MSTKRKIEGKGSQVDMRLVVQQLVGAALVKGETQSASFRLANTPLWITVTVGKDKPSLSPQA